jgi:hypothetical protein
MSCVALEFSSSEILRLDIGYSLLAATCHIEASPETASHNAALHLIEVSGFGFQVSGKTDSPRLKKTIFHYSNTPSLHVFGTK